MKAISHISLAALLAACCVTTAFAQAQGACNPNGPKTRAEVRADLTQWRAAGYDPLDWADYPENAQRAGRIVAQQRAAAGNAGACAQ
ncbi:DUF4148 domain-containing protein [Paraburkholderia phenazinium]|jgi:hypothetical protein|uniref:DUF4148 domain-containing protein n=1 Tax=Paraburkholderia phenazinium TaxID=60549 RepID=A0A1G8B4D3_9BURK|nr:DUF4148 domain-containing protein [Paraburkholderia phenazinium]SDH28046.1 protein of unknown function [Paraburkholderia phenazinium]